MAKGWTGVQLLVKVGRPTSVPLSVTYGAAPNDGGLELITTLLGVPSNLITVPTARDESFNQAKQSDRVKYYGSAEDGVLFEAANGTTGSLNVTLSRSEANESIYEPSCDLLMSAASTPNKMVFLSFERYMGVVPASPKYRYHYRAGLFLISTDGQDQTDSTHVMRTFQFSNTGVIVNGLRDYAA